MQAEVNGGGGSLETWFLGVAWRLGFSAPCWDVPGSSY